MVKVHVWTFTRYRSIEERKMSVDREDYRIQLVYCVHCIRRLHFDLKLEGLPCDLCIRPKSIPYLDTAELVVNNFLRP